MTESQAYRTIARIIGGCAAACAGVSVAIHLVGGTLAVPALVAAGAAMAWAATLLTRSRRT